MEQKALIYVVDDDEAIRKAMTRLLKVSGFTVQSYDSALSFLAQPPSPRIPAYLILDIHMPGMTGLELVEHMAKNKMDIPTILITAFDDPLASYIDRPLVLACLHKPVEESKILALISDDLTKQPI